MNYYMVLTYLETLDFMLEGNKDIRFMSLRLETNWWPGTKIAVVNTHLVALKEGPRFPGAVEI